MLKIKLDKTFHSNLSNAPQQFSYNEYLNISKCTSLLFGETPILQKCYICPLCNPKRNHYLCQYCYFTCHNNCRVNHSDVSLMFNHESNQLKPEQTKPFACYCGINLKHKPVNINRKEIIPCSMLVLDQILDAKSFYCQTHSIFICCICSVTCHKTCNIAKNINSSSSVARCACKSEFHTNYNELALTFPLDDYRVTTGVNVWPIQILNILFSTRYILKQMSELFIKTIENDNNFDNANIDERFFPLLEIFSNNLNHKFKTFYYDKELKKIFDYEKMTHFMFGLNIKNEKFCLVKFRLIFIILFIHLKQDYQQIKNLTSIDFLSGPIIERLKYKLLISSKNPLTEKTHTKYFNDENLMKRIALEEICILMEKGMSHLSIEEHQYEFEIGLKYICFMLKRMMFNNDDLCKLSKSLFVIFDKVYEYITSNENENVKPILHLFNAFVEIFLMICVSYNDNIIENYIENNYNVKFINFIQTKNECGDLIFKMILKSCEVLKRHYAQLEITVAYQTITSAYNLSKVLRNKGSKHDLMFTQIGAGNGFMKDLNNKEKEKNEGFLNEKIISIFNHTLQLLSIADNFYSKKISQITNKDIESYLNFKELLFGDYGNSQMEDKFFFLIIKDKYTNEQNPVIALKENIENILNDFFTHSLNDKTMLIDIKIQNEINTFVTKINEYFDLLGKYYTRVSPFVKHKKIDDNEKFSQSLIKKLKHIFPFVNNDFFSYLKNKFVQTLIMYSLDETITKILVFFSNRNYPHLLSFSLLEEILSLLSLYLLTKDGVNFLTLGKNFTRISKLFRRYSFRVDNKNVIEKYNRTVNNNIKYTELTLQFICLFSKGINVYQVDLTDHKVLIRLRNHLLEHIEVFVSRKYGVDNYLYDIMEHLCMILKYFSLMSDYYNFESLNAIKLSFVLLFCYSKMNLMDKNAFINLYKNNKNNIEYSQIYSGVKDTIGIGAQIRAQKKINNITKVTLSNNNINTNDSKQINLNTSTTRRQQSKDFLLKNTGNNNLDQSEFEVIESEQYINNNNHHGNMDYIFSFSQVTNPIKGKSLHNIILKVYYLLFELVSKGSFFAFNGSVEESAYEKIFSFNDIKEFRLLLRNNSVNPVNTTNTQENNITNKTNNEEIQPRKISLRERTILLNFLKTFSLFERVDKGNFTRNKRLFTNQEYKELLKQGIIDVEGNLIQNTNSRTDIIKFIQVPETNNNNNNNNNVNPTPSNKKLDSNVKSILDTFSTEEMITRYNYIFKIDELIKIYLEELNAFPNQITGLFYKKNDKQHKRIKQFISELIFGSKFIADVFFHSKDLINKLNLDLYLLTKLILIKSQQLILYYNDDSSITYNTDLHLNEINNSKLNEMKSVGFNVYNKTKVYKILTEEINRILKQTNLYHIISLPNYLGVFDSISEANFTPFSLIETYDYEYFYETEETKKESKQYQINDDIESHSTVNNNNNNDNTTNNDLTNEYREQFINITNTNFYNVITNISNESIRIDYRKKLVNYFLSFLNSTEMSKGIEKIEMFFVLVNKLLFYDGEESQSKLEGVRKSDTFFSNICEIVHKFIVMSMVSCSRDEGNFDFSMKMISITKLIIQFLQLLGEGFNLEFHPHIFHTERSLMKINQKLKQSLLEANAKEEDSQLDNSDTIIRSKIENERVNTEENKEVVHNEITKEHNNGNLKKVRRAITEVKNSVLNKYQYEQHVQFTNNQEGNEDYLHKSTTKQNNHNSYIEVINNQSLPQQSVYLSLLLYLKKSYCLMDIFQDINSELSYDKLMILSTNIIDFLIEYIDSTSENCQLISNAMRLLFFGTDPSNLIPSSNKDDPDISRNLIQELLLGKYIIGTSTIETTKSPIREKIIIYIKIKFIQLLISFLQTGKHNDFVAELISQQCSPLDLYLELLYNFNEMIQHLRRTHPSLYKRLSKKQNDETFVKELIYIYVYENVFNEMIEFTLCMKLYILIRTYEEMYGHNMLREHFSKLIMMAKEKKMIYKCDEYEKEENKFDMYSNFSLRIFMFMEKMILKVDIKNQDEEDENNDEIEEEISKKKDIEKTKLESKLKEQKNKKEEQSLIMKFAQKFSSVFYFETSSVLPDISIKHTLTQQDKLIVNEQQYHGINNNNNNNHSKIMSHKYINKDSYPMQTECDNNNKLKQNPTSSSSTNPLFKLPNQPNNSNYLSLDKKTSFFVRPYLTFRLSKQSKISFESNVNRESASSKYMELINFSDYSILEMITNSHLISRSPIKQFLSNINYFTCELINFLFIIINNLLFIIYHYRSPYENDYNYNNSVKNDRYKFHLDIFIIAIVQLVFDLAILCNWIYFNYALCYQHLIMKRYNKNFVFRKKGQSHSEVISQKIINYFKPDSNLSVFSVIKNKNKDLSIFQSLKVGIDALLFNREISVLVYSMIFIILYMCLNNELVLLIPVLFIANITPTLFDIIRAITMKFSQMASVLAFTAFVVYVFMWITILHMPFLFKMEDILEFSSGETITEHFCTSSLQCFMYILQQGLKAGGGIGEVLPMMSFKEDPGFFVARFFYDMLFFILIIMILFNVFMGIIVDTFAELRDINWSRENDIQNVCFICQLTRDDCLKESIDFSKHVQEEHLLWNYIFFLVHLHINNPNDFNSVENYVWEKLEEQDFGWIPINDKAE